MVLRADTIWEIRTAGSVNNGGGFYYGASGTDYSQQDNPQYALTGCTSAAANAIILNANAASDMVGNLCKVVSGTNATVGWYEIISVSVGVSMTVDRNWCTGAVSSGVVNVGGAVTWGDDAFFEGWVPGMVAYVKADGTHTGTALVVAKDGTTASPMRIEGYNTTRGDAWANEANRATIDFGANSFNFDNYWKFVGLDVTGTGSPMATLDQEALIWNCKFSNTSGSNARTALNLDRRTNVSFSEFTSTNGTGCDSSQLGNWFNFCYFHDCRASDSSNGALRVTGDDTMVTNCIFDTSGWGLRTDAAENCSYSNCTVYNCIYGVFQASAAPGQRYSNFIIDNCTTGIQRTPAADNTNPIIYINFNFSNNTTDKSANVTETFINETSSDPQFVDAAGGDFETGANMEMTYAWPGGLTSTTVKNGAVQNTGGGGGGGSIKASAGLHNIGGGISTL